MISEQICSFYHLMQLLVLRIALHARLVEIYFDSFRNGAISGEDSPTFGHANAFLCSFIQYKESISKEKNNVMISIQC